MLHNRFLKTMTVMLGAIIAGAGLIFLLAWHLGATSMLEVPYITSLNLVILGVALLSMFSSWRITNILGGLLFFINAIGLEEKLFSVDSGLLEYPATLLSYTLDQFPSPSLIENLCNLMLGAILAFWTKTRHSVFGSSFLLLSCFIVLILSFVSIGDHYYPSETWWHSTNLYSSIFFILAVIGIVSARIYYETLSHFAKNSLLPYLISLLSFFFVLLLAFALYFDKHQASKQTIRTETEVLHQLIHGYLSDNVVNSMSEMTKKMAANHKISKAQWMEEANNQMSNLIGIQSIIWANSQFVIIEMAPDNNKTDALFDQLSLDPNHKMNIMNAFRDEKVYAAFNKSHTQLSLFYPVYWDKTLQGSLVYTINIAKFFQITIPSELLKNYALQIHADTIPIFSYPSENFDVHSPKTTSTFDFNNIKFTLDLYPSEQISSTFTNTFLILLLLGGIVLTLMLGSFFRAWQKKQGRLDAIEEFRNAQLSKAQDELEFSLNGTKIGTWQWDLLSSKIIWDKTTYSLFGVEDGKEIDLEYFNSLIHPEDRERLIQESNDAIKSGKPSDYTYRIILPNGATHFIHSRAKLISNDQNIPIAMLGFSWDVTDLKQKELFLKASGKINKALHEAESIEDALARLKQIMYSWFGWDSIGLWTYQSDVENFTCAHITSNDTALNHALTKEETIPKALLRSHKPFWASNIGEPPNDAFAEAASKSGFKSMFAIPLMQAESLIGILILFKQELLRNVDDEMINFMNETGADFVQFYLRVHSEKSKSYLNKIMNQSSIGIYTSDLNGILTSWNKGCEKFYGYTENEIIGKNASILSLPDKVQEFNVLLKLMLSGIEVLHHDTENCKKDGSHIRVNKLLSLVKDNDGHPIGLTVIVENITKKKLAQVNPANKASS